MTNKIYQILEKYWGFKKFRYLQEDIILSVLNNKDTLALLPTGGGKSLTFQIPALYKEGICLVVTPLIALMKDQLSNLKEKGITAAAIYSGMTYNEIDRTLDNAIYGSYKFLYVSPERLETDIFRLRALKMPVNLIAVDEAHCISQWGYDFRPSYLKIAEIRKFFPKIPILALTATATKEVKDDIIDKLEFKNAEVFQKSFERENLVYAVLHEEAKRNKLVDILNKVTDSGIVYVRTRKSAKEVAFFLQQNKISADFYHAGLDQKARSTKQNDWKSGKTRIIVSTNAFGMGIDKSNVRTVIHMHLPDSLEAYYQEAGRAGRDLKRAYAIALVNNNDISDLEYRVKTSFPKTEEIKSVYKSLANYFQIPIGSGKGMEFTFEINDFCNRYNLNLITTFNCLKELGKANLLSLSSNIFMPSRLFFKIGYRKLYDYQIEFPKYEAIIKTILRSYDGIFDHYIKFDEGILAKRLNTNKTEIVKQLNYLKKIDILDYLSQTDKARIIFISERVDDNSIFVDPAEYHKRKKNFESKINSVIKYAFETKACKSKQLLGYFGEKLKNDCGHCDYCLKGNKINITDFEFKNIFKKTIALLNKKPYNMDKLIEQLNDFEKDNVIYTIRWLIDNNRIKSDKNSLLRLTKGK
ncbi:MAG: ATP-dependent DNA helicase RecQ [Bacteroidota bacterium]|nr:ATP-dependent DNA helicase RecQ [Bacteroidota bacterium]